MEKEKMCLDIILNIEKVFNSYSSYSQCQREYFENSGIYYEKEVHLLKEIIENPTQTITEIAEKNSRTKSSVSQIVKRLIEKKLLNIKKDNIDKRKIIFEPTEKGINLYTAHNYYDNKMAHFLSQFLNAYSIEDISKFLEILNVYHNFMKQGYSLADIKNKD